MHVPVDEVSACLRELAAELVLPRFRALARHDVHEKAPGELVTVVDRETEHALAHRLGDLVPGSRVVGEEASASDPSLVSMLGSGLAWIVDPLDGTANFVAGRESFAMMVALVRDGEPVASWIYAPVTGSLAVAVRGEGAVIDGTRVRITEQDAMLVPAGVVKTRFLPPELRTAFDALASSGGTGSAGIEYVDLVQNRVGFLAYWRTEPWDHVPGALLVAEAGGHTARLDGSAYRVSEPGTGLLVARSVTAWRALRSAIAWPR